MSEQSDPPAASPAAEAVAAGSVGDQLYGRINGIALPDLGRVREALAGGGPRPRRRIESSLPPRSHVLPVPNGWYAIVASDELAEGDLVSIRLVDRELVVARDELGRASVLDAHCPHMGAHLGGGRVVGERVKCPYHGWEFGADGRCVRIPYSDSRIPSRARVRSYPVHEADGLVYFWYHAADAPPNFEIPAVPEASDPSWSEAYPWRFELVAALQEMAENNVDYAHFRYVHGKDVIPRDISAFHFDGPCSWVEESLGDGVSFIRHSYGPGVAILRFPSLMTIVAATTPIDRGNCRLLWHFYFPRELEAAAEDLIVQVTGPYGLQADVPIWRDLSYRERPVLVKGDGPIAEFRRWYAQFYEGNGSGDRPGHPDGPSEESA
ncbi:aromatic ring-hydroxylating dioxygenase subunit alpha [Rhabdothermincola sp.]|uniref:aromatic ring-hydroxylating dioxygenase subunit alpha n=1 Tax=Rhabdothermincola sp. TaxID=2820405 RepID=UPI002FE113EF